MQVTRMVQAVILMMIVAIAASCAAGKEYAGKLFSPKDIEIKDSQQTVIRFLELGELEIDKENWVTTDIITGKDTTQSTIALDKLSKQMPATVSAEKKDSIDTNASVKGEAVVKSPNPNGTRTKRVRDK